MRLIDADKLDMSVKVDGDRTLSPISQLIAQTIIENAQTIESDEDCISRKHLEERIKFASEMSANETDDFKLGVSAVLLLIKAEPSVQPKTGWIPVSERLPKPYQECLFTVIASHWANEPVTYRVIQKAYGGEQNFIAWMPLPEPYKPTDSEKE